ncbi:hypothetical protein B4140_2337 [Bacillus sp. CN2]|nr:hypothetical protein BCBMB205_24710 [Bacillus velezensis]KYC86661.1 hypothetical protein B4140_2337 [Bacillus amyloliquefaciens]GFR55907.1 hypothetical protein B4140_2337 [Bacillus sp. CN2]ARZ58813.1 hypothetical protein BAGQ_2581 [Bacillus velezensis]QEY91106.1 hypothetical protein BACIT_3271 [Bacillus amyloliquefaciens]
MTARKNNGSRRSPALRLLSVKKKVFQNEISLYSYSVL